MRLIITLICSALARDSGCQILAHHLEVRVLMHGVL